MYKPYFIGVILTNPFLIYPMIIIIYSLIIYMILKDYNNVFLGIFSLSLFLRIQNLYLFSSLWYKIDAVKKCLWVGHVIQMSFDVPQFVVYNSVKV